jgi:GNAT superfamily N-acetyltransferase
MRFDINQYRKFYRRQKKTNQKKTVFPSIKDLKIVESRREIRPRSNKVLKRYFIVGDPKIKHIVGGITYYSNPKEDPSIRYKHISKKDASFDNFGLLPKYRNKGFGTRMIKKVEHAAKEDGKDRVLLAVRGYNKKAINLYNKLGYDVVHKTTLHKGPLYTKEGAKRKPAFIMAKKLH